MQVTLASILVGTRFKCFEKRMMGGSIRLPTECRWCGERDSPAHILEHIGVTSVPTMPEELIEFLAKVAREADVVNPHISKPHYLQTSMDLELMPLQTDSEASSDGELSFDHAETA